MTAFKELIFAGITLATLASATRSTDAKADPAGLPADVAAFVSRSVACSDLSKKAMDPEWITQLDAIYRNIQLLKCFYILDDNRALREKYAGSPEILASLSSGNYSKFITRLPVRPPASDR